MPHRRGDMFRRVLSGLLVLVVLMLPAGRADALTLPVFDADLHAALAEHGDEHRGLTTSPAQSHSESPCDDCDHPDGLACCLSCGFFVGNLPSIHPAPVPLASASLKYLMSSTSPPDGLTNSPDLPPPRQNV
jgi:hypothetical protein